MARPAKTPAIKELAGNPGTRPIPEEPSFPKDEIPKCPTHLKGEARREWKRVSVELYEAGLLAKVDRAALAIYCKSWERWVKAEKELNEQELVLTSKEGGKYHNPWLSVANKAMADIEKYMSKFGMTPASRKNVTPTQSKDKDPYEEWMENA